MSSPKLTRTQWLILWAAWLGWVFDIMDSALFAFAKEPMLTEMLGGKAAYKLNGPALEGRIQTFFLIGWAIGGLCFGILADRWGRTRTLILTILSYSLLTGVTVLCRTPEQVMVVRFFTALGIGGEWAAGAALVAEALPDQLRPRASALLQSAAAFGPWFAAAINLALPPGSWKTMFLIGVAPALLVVLIRFGVKEPERSQAAERHENAGSLSHLFGNPRWRRNAIVAMIIGVVGVTGAGILPFWLPNLTKEVAHGLPAVALKNFVSYNTFSLHIGTLAGVFLFPLICERLGRKPSFALFFVFCLASLGAIAQFGTTLDRLLWLLPIGAFFTIGLSAGFVLYFPELFPTRLRATGSGLAYNVGRIASAPAPYAIGRIITSTGSVALGVAAYSTVYLIGLAALPFAPETKGKPLPEEA